MNTKQAWDLIKNNLVKLEKENRAHSETVLSAFGLEGNEENHVFSGVIMPKVKKIEKECGLIAIATGNLSVTQEVAIIASHSESFEEFLVIVLVLQNKKHRMLRDLYEGNTSGIDVDTLFAVLEKDEQEKRLKNDK